MIEAKPDAWRDLLVIVLGLPETADDDRIEEAIEAAKAKLATNPRPGDQRLPSESRWKSMLASLVGVGPLADMKEMESAAAVTIETLHGVKMLSADERAICRQLGLKEGQFVLNSAAPKFARLPPGEDKVRRLLGISEADWRK
jgi:hypothetical protein